MILYRNVHPRIIVLKANNNPILCDGFPTDLSVVQVGELVRKKPRLVGTVWSGNEWTFKVLGRNAQAISDFLEHSEKREIIGLLDRLNNHYRPDNEMQCYWNKLIGLAG